MNNRTFLLRWKENGMDIDFDESAVDKYVKAVIVLGRMSGERVNVPTNKEYIDMMIETVHAKANGREPLASFYKTLTAAITDDLTRDIIEFQGEIDSGPDKGKYVATLLRFNDDGILEPVDDIVIAKEGYIKEIDKHGLPVTTTKEWGPIENIDTDGLEPPETRGKLMFSMYSGLPPEIGEQRMVLHSPGFESLGFFFTKMSENRDSKSNGVGSLRVKRSPAQD